MSISGVKIKNDSGEEVYALRESGSVVNFGRDKKVCHITFDPQASRVSRLHASLEWTDEGLFFIDKSKEGTIIDGKCVKQSQKTLDEGTHQVQIGGISMIIEVEGPELEETVLDSPNKDDIPETVSMKPPVGIVPRARNARKVAPAAEESDDDFDDDDVSSISTFSTSKYKPSLKRKSDATLFDFDESQPRGKRGPVASKPLNFVEEEMENRGNQKDTRARKADDSVVFEEEAPAKKSRTVEEPKQNKEKKPVPFSSQQLMKNYFRPKVECEEEEKDDGMAEIVSQVASIPPVSQEIEKEEEPDHQHPLDNFDRGPAAPNETIKYTNLIFQQPELNRTIKIDPSVPNFKRFVPKSLKSGEGRTSAASMYSRNNTTTSFNTTIPMIDSRRIHR